jgi:hypothetical protein
MDVEPRQHGTDETQAFASQCDGISDMVLNTDLLEEEAATVTERSAVGYMRHERHAGDLSATKIGPAESVPVRGAGTLLLLQLVGVDHQGDCIVVVDVVLWVGESL